MLLPTRKMLHFTSLGLKENYSSCTGAKPCVCLSLSGWFVPLGPRQHRGAGRNSQNFKLPENWAVGWKAWSGQTFLFPLGNQVRVREQQETQGFVQPSHGELGELPSLIKLKSYTEKKMFPF